MNSSNSPRHDVQTCRDHHAVLLALLGRMQNRRPLSPAAMTEGLADLHLVLLRHLAFEDEHLYPFLAQHGSPEVAARARLYQEEMGSLRERFERFFATWPSAAAIAAQTRRFADEWYAVREALERRIAAEDDDLYELAERTLSF